MSEVLSIVLTGRGGQGVKLSSELLAWSASADGYNPIQYSVYGALIRGGEIACSLAASREDPGVPLRSDYSLMCAMHNDWFDRYYPLLVCSPTTSPTSTSRGSVVVISIISVCLSPRWRRKRAMRAPGTW